MMAHPFITLGLAFGMMTALWPLSVRLRDVSIVDILWAPAFAVLAWSMSSLRRLSACADGSRWR